MKICHKKNFWAGAGMLALGLLNLVTALWRRDFDLSTGVLVGALLLLGALTALCAAAVVLFVLLLCVNIYYEKRG